MLTAREIEEWNYPGIADSRSAPLRLDIAAKIAFPDGSIGTAGLRKERNAGRLVTEIIANKEYTTLGAIENMRELCRVHRKAPDSSGETPTSRKTAHSCPRPAGTSKTAESDTALVAAKASLLKLKSSSPTISPKDTSQRARDREPDQVKIADVINVYADDVARKHAAPKATATRLLTIHEFFGSKKLSDINGKLCRDYADQAPFLPTARRQLEDLRAAINHYHEEGYVTTVPKIVMPPKSIARQRWLTRSEAARLLWAAWRMRQSWRGQESDRRTGQHIARFILVAVYTGTRSGAICAAAIRPTEGRGYVDLDRGVFFRRAAGERETKKRQPPVRLPDRLVAHIRRWSTTPVDVKTKARGKSKTIGRMIAHDHVVEWQGESVQSIRKAFQSAVKAAGLGEFDVGGNFSTDITPHILRHTAATWLMQNGTDLSLAADYLGMSEAVLREVYYHHHPDFQEEASERITAKSPALRVKANVVRLR